MKMVKVIIERSNDAFWAYAENLEGVSGVGATANEAKQSLLDSIAIQKELGNVKHINYEISYQFDIASLLNYYKGIFTFSALERLTGINQRQIERYSKGEKKPRETMRKKIEASLHQLGEELLTVQL